MTASHDFHAGDLFGELYEAEAPPPKRKLREFIPGLAVCGTAALAAAWLAEHYGFPIILLGLLIGLALSFLSELESTAAGFDFASRYLLQAGIVLLGLQVTFGEVTSLGWAAFGGLLLVMVASFAGAVLTAKAVGERTEAGILAGGATAICGASAALALYAVIGKDRLDQARFSVTLVGIAVASAIAMSVYPAIAQLAGLTDTQAGFLIGASVHDAAQAIGGAYSYSDAAGASATVIKLSRVAMLAPMVALMAWWIARTAGPSPATDQRRFPLPWFIPLFFAVLIINSMIELPQAASIVALDFSKACLLLAVTATAMRSRLGLLLEAGWRTLAPVIVATLVSFALAFVCATMLT